MRPIKFRAWNKKLKTMGSAMPLDVILLNAAEDPSGPQEELANCEVMQFTGLHDKNGKEIYEGDVVTSHNGAVEGVVKYQAPTFIIQMPHRKTWSEFILSPDQNQFQEIIGNIYENPAVRTI